MTTDIIVQKIDRARLLLAECRDATDAKRVTDLAHAAEIYAKRQQLSQETIDAATAIKIDAKTMLGDFLDTMPKNQGGNPNLKPTGSHGAPVGNTLKDQGFTKKESAESQGLAELKRRRPEIHAAVRAGKTSIRRALAEARPKPATARPKPVAVPEPEDAPDFQAELADAHREIEGQEKLIESLMKSDLAKELAVQKGKWDALNGRLNQVLTTEAEAKRTAKYQGEQLAAICRALDVKKHSEIIPAIKALQK